MLLPLGHPAIGVGAVIGSLLPDVDHPQSWVGRRTRPISTALAATLGHRGVTHSALALIGLMALLLHTGNRQGAVSALASTFPELVAGAVREPGSFDLVPVRAALERFPFQAAAKIVLAKRGVPIGPDVRRPLRMLTDEERRELEQWLESSSPVPVP